MKKKAKQRSLGIALTERYVEAVLLECAGREVRLRRGGRMALPDGVIRDGRIRDPKKLGATVRSLLRREGIRRKRAVVCLPDRAVLTQMLEMPRSLPSNLHGHIRSEIRHSPQLTGREPVYDFLRLGEGEADTSRLFVGAADRERLEELFQAFRPIGLEVDAVEIKPAAVLRALQRGLFKPHRDRSLLVADWSAGTLTVCVLVKEQLDFIRRTVLPEDAEPAQAIRDELNAIRQFYELEKGLFFDAGWLGVAVSDSPEPPEADWKESLGQTLGMEVHPVGGPGLISDLGLQPGPKALTVSACAAGLALRPFEPGKYLEGLDFLPAAVRQFYQLKRLVKRTLAACAAVVLLMVLLSLTSGMRIERLASAKAAETSSPERPVAELVETRKELAAELGLYHREVKSLERVMQAAPAGKWSSLLQGIRRQAPGDLWIASLEIDRAGEVTVRGQAAAHGIVYQFLDRLKQSDQLVEPQLARIQLTPEPSLYVDYTLTGRLPVASSGDCEQ